MLKVVVEYTHWDRSPEAAVKLVHRGLGRLGQHPKVVLILASQEYDLPAMLPPLRILLGDVPVWGGTLRQIWSPEEGRPARSLEVALVWGDELEAEAVWFPTLDQAEVHDWRAWEGATVWTLVDAQTPRMPRWMRWLGSHQGELYGSVIGNTAYLMRAYLCGGARGGTGGATVMALRGLDQAVHWGTGWAPTGILTEVTESRAERVYRLDGQLAAERLSQWFGGGERRWVRPPLRELARMYPLAVEERRGLQWYAPLAVETDGSLRMTLPLRRGHMAHLMVGSATDCLEAARRTAQQALQDFPGEKPALAMLLVDWAWAHLFWARPWAVYRVVQEVLGEDVPILGGYGYGPIARPVGEEGSPLLWDNHLLLALWG